MQISIIIENFWTYIYRLWVGEGEGKTINYRMLIKCFEECLETNRMTQKIII